ncbi:hypothetical protein C499_13435 [Halogeometricum borinquense DSM 11551]|uniref:Uncharacterized protein n=1 Tax=Halogeometricum borinquense (strain ATCC 700274 / DSM 11551 / JCM 10706 / KCTC 4070 / PR3) TaxID=469382 RepID=E4NUB7_HALBP|nr:hypothetical protein [Halogeometricum borinquense]ADQ68637.1 hypothetical protein Hbor_31010 [Halogeometricum borinquense DSM 11551]ELY25490.1 hypothetical protein C499_13435 [Halogeometricum borinquense DSM 11551]
MVGTTLIELRNHIEALASDNGSYYLVCGRTGERPIPTSGLRFERRVIAQSAARAAEQYRTALRRYDSRLPYRDLIVCQDAEPIIESDSQEEQPPDATQWSLSEPVLSGPTPDGDRQLVEFCHSVAAAVFETLCDDGYRSVETAVMDEYLELAETVSDPDDLCLCLLESMAIELDTQLTQTEQANVLSRAAARLPSPEPADDPVAATFARLQRLGLLGAYTQSPWSIDFDEGVRSVVVEVSEYALSARDGRLPVLPVVLDLSRRQLDWSLSALRIAEVETGWQVTLVLERDANVEYSANVPILSGA